MTIDEEALAVCHKLRVDLFAKCNGAWEASTREIIEAYEAAKKPVMGDAVVASAQSEGCEFDSRTSPANTALVKKLVEKAHVIKFLHDRLIYVHGENENVDYLHAMRAHIKALTEAQAYLKHTLCQSCGNEGLDYCECQVAQQEGKSSEGVGGLPDAFDIGEVIDDALGNPNCSGFSKAGQAILDYLRPYFTNQQPLERQGKCGEGES